MLPLLAYLNALALHQRTIDRTKCAFAETCARTRLAQCLANARAAYPHHSF